MLFFHLNILSFLGACINFQDFIYLMDFLILQLNLRPITLPEGQRW